jgi:predicted component of viral defense system (DUF524 family)
MKTRTKNQKVKMEKHNKKLLRQTTNFFNLRKRNQRTFSSVTLATFAGQETQRSMPGMLELPVRHDGRDL